MNVTLCDVCPRTARDEASYHVTFNRLPPRGVDGQKADDSLDLCQRHYDEVYEALAVIRIKTNAEAIA